jgi:signal transduction histidine kinase
LIGGLLVQRLRRRPRAAGCCYVDLGGRLIVAQEVERARIARELHDDVSQQLAALSIALSGLKRRAGAAANASDLENDVASLQQRATTLAESVRALSHDLHPDVLRHVGLGTSLTAYCNRVSRSNALEVTCTAEGDWESLSPDVALCLYRIAQEALNEGTTVRVRIPIHARPSIDSALS